jgi:glycosyltransferase involved in cell wall biosynthesis
VGVLTSSLRKWDARAAASADRYLANSTVTRDAIKDVYGIEAEILPPPPALLPNGPQTPVPDLEPGYVLCVARLLPYKNVDAVIGAAIARPSTRLVVVGGGPDLGRLRAMAGDSGRIRLLGRVPDEQLRWLYRNSSALVAASYEDYGLSPLEAAAFAKPSVVMHAGGYLDTVVEHRTGVFFEEPVAEQIAAALDVAADRTWDESALRAHAEAFGAQRFQARLKNIVAEERLLV